MGTTVLTYCDKNYAARGIMMIWSVLKYNPDAEFILLALDDRIDEIIKGYFHGRVRTVPLRRLADCEPRLPGLKKERSPWEYYATHKPVFIRWALTQRPDDEIFVYTDADTYYFNDFSPILNEMGDFPIGFSLHRFNPETEHLNIYGKYNAGFSVWRNNEEARACLGEWKEDCIDWCRAKADGARFMNQGYLAGYAKRRSVREIAHAGHNLAYWNLATHCIDYAPDGVLVDGLPLIFFHFSGLARWKRDLWVSGQVKIDPLRNVALLRTIFHPYLKSLERLGGELEKWFGVDGLGSVRGAPRKKAINLTDGAIVDPAMKDGAGTTRNAEPIATLDNGS